MKIMVTGGGGFLGGAISKKLKNMGHEPAGFSRGKYPELEKMGIKTIQGDLADVEAVTKAFKGFDAVMHVAAKAGIWGAYEEYYKPNVLGTENVIKACRANNINKLVFTSSPSVVFSGSDHEKVDESAPYPDTFLNNYQRTKAESEKMALDADSDELYTVALRPHMIWGPGDTNLIPRLIKRAKAGQLRIVGDGKNLVDSVYVDNAADAHILALQKLEKDSVVRGKPYFITNGEPITMAELLNKVLSAAGLPPVEKKIPASAAYFIGALMEFAYGVLNKDEEPRMTRFLAKELSCAHYYDISAARRDLGYEPKVSIDEGMEKLKKWLAERNI